jgi:hypothetical protein
MFAKVHFGAALILVLMMSQAFAEYAQADARTKNHREVNLSGIESKKREKGTAEKASGPSMGRGEAFVVATEGKLSSEIKKTIEFYKRTERTLPPKSSARLQMLERLVNLYLESAVYEANSEFRRYDQAYANWVRAGGKGKSPTVDNSASKNTWKQVASTSAYVMKQFPNTRNSDALMFNQGLALQYLGQDKQSARVYSDLIQKLERRTSSLGISFLRRKTLKTPRTTTSKHCVIEPAVATAGLSSSLDGVHTTWATTRSLLLFGSELLT